MHKKVISSLTLDEKARLLIGAGEWETASIPEKSVPSVTMSDGPHGLRKQRDKGDHLGLNGSVPSTCFPTAATLANSWDVQLLHEVGKAIGEEAQALGINIVLGPGVNMKRSPLCGRNFEYFSEDPYLTGKLASSYIKGLQCNNAGACVKHYACNSQELRRQCMDAVVDERTLRELYLTAFEMVVKEAHPYALMTSYNKINGIYANEHPHLVKDILRGEWGYDGLVMSDWGGDHNHTEALKNGSDLLMPYDGEWEIQQLVSDIQEGKIEQSALDERVLDILRTAEIFSGATWSDFDISSHHETARKAAEESVVLLSNDGILPLKKDQKVALIGKFARSPRYQGAGSSLVNPTKLDTLEDSLKKLGCNLVGCEDGFDFNSPKENSEKLKKATVLALEADVVLLCIGLDDCDECEGIDRMTLELSSKQQKLIREICLTGKPVVLILSGGAPFLLPEGSYNAVIHGYLSGQGGGTAMSRNLYGLHNPCGKLNETWPLSLEDTPCANYYPSHEKTSEYREGLYSGYRYYDTASIPVMYPFGYGLSYTCFSYSNLRPDENGVTFTITNTGTFGGSEIAQLYISKPESAVYRPKKELKGFIKIFLEAGESRDVRIDFDEYTFRIFDTSSKSFITEAGEYFIFVGRNVSDICLTFKIDISGTELSSKCGLPHYISGDIRNVPDSEYALLLGKDIPESRWNRAELSMEDSVSQLSYSRSVPGKLIYSILNGMREKSERKGKPNMAIQFAYNVSFNGIAKICAGMVSRTMAEDLLNLCNGNGHFNLSKLLCHFIQNSVLQKSRK